MTKYLAIIFLFLKRLVTFHSPVSALSTNPKLYLSGLLQVLKSDLLNDVDGFQAMKAAPFVLISGSWNLDDVKKAHRHLGGHWPVVVKPNIGERGLGVYVAHNTEELAAAARAQAGDFLVQTFIAGDEFGVFALLPLGSEEPTLIIGQKFAPFVTGNGRDNLDRLIAAQKPKYYRRLIGRQRLNLDTIPNEGEVVELDEVLHGFRGTTQQLVLCEVKGTRLLEQICAYCKDFDHRFGRIDYRAKNLGELLAGNGSILEINGLASLSPEHSVPGTTAWRHMQIMYDLWQHAYAIGDANIKEGHPRHSFFELVSATVRHLRYKYRFRGKSGRR